MKKLYNLYTDNDHTWNVVARDPEKPGFLIDTNEYLITRDGKGLLTDPGGLEIFPAVFSALSQEHNPESITAIFSSHQDPDILSSLSLWLEANPEIKCYVSWLWKTFVPHFGGTDSTFITIPDPGMEIELGRLKLDAIPAHYLHSAGNFNLYDKKAKIFFSGDIGVALLPQGDDGLYVENFDAHRKHIEVFHRRWMASNRARVNWCERVAGLEIDMLCPQHGKIYRGKDVERFINWFSEFQVGVLQE